MSWVLYFIVFLWTIAGILFLFAPAQGKKLYRKIVNNGSFWLWGIIALVFSYLLWRSAAIVLQPWFVQLLAVLAGIKGICCLIIPKDKFRVLIDRFLQMSDVAFRIWGVVILFLAYFLLSVL